MPAGGPGLELAPTKADEIRADANGIAVLMDPSTAQRANGLFVDTVESLQGSGFTFEKSELRLPPSNKWMFSTLNADIEAGESLYLFDVRGPDERAKARIKAAVPFDEAAERLIETLPQDTPLLFHCHGGGAQSSGRGTLPASRLRERLQPGWWN